MTTINEIKDRLNAVAFAGRSYAGADRAAVAKAYTDAVAAAALADAALTIADRYAGNAAEALEIRLLIGDSVDKLVNIAQGAAITTEEAGE